eukprot:SAG31_NODE_19772_length_592_cov_0.726166_1_plen_38_part_01
MYFHHPAARSQLSFRSIYRQLIVGVTDTMEYYLRRLVA